MLHFSAKSTLSKAGKKCLNQHKILKEREEILKQKNKKKLIISEKPGKKEKILDILLRSPKEQKSLLSRTPKPELLSFSHKSPDSEYITSEFFSPTYNLQDKHIPTVKFSTKKTSARKPLEKQVKFHSHTSSVKTLEDHRFLINFNKQLGRDFSIKKNQSDARFETSPKYNSAKPSWSFDKQVPRADLFKKQVFPDYNPQKEKFLKKISKTIDFKKYLQRNSEKPKFLPDFYDVKYSCVDPKPRYCRIGK